MRFCARCGSSSSVHQHHHPRKGLGGSKKWRGTLVPLCWAHHEDLHMKRWTLEVEDGYAYGFSPEGLVLFSRKLETDPA